VYNLLAKGDFVTATSFRKVQQTSSTGSSTAQKVKIRLTIEIETIEFDTQTCELRVKGKNTEVSRATRAPVVNCAQRSSCSVCAG
jgi:protein pelota